MENTVKETNSVNSQRPSNEVFADDESVLETGRFIIECNRKAFFELSK